MYEDGITVEYRLTTGENGWGQPAHVWMPGWCAGDPAMAVALTFFGNRDYVTDVEVIDWQPAEPTEPEPHDSRPWGEQQSQIDYLETRHESYYEEDSYYGQGD